MIIISCVFLLFPSSSFFLFFLPPAVTLRLLCVLHGKEERKTEREGEAKKKEANALKGLVSCLPELIEIV